MKKYNLFLWFIALVGLITSCSQDEAAGPQNEASNRVRIGASIDQALQTRAGSVTIPEHYQLRYILEVWNTEVTPACVYRDEKTAPGAEAVEFDFILSEAKDYKALLWADFVIIGAREESKTTPNSYTHYADSYYTTDSDNGLTSVGLKAGNYVINDDSRDAFFACLPFEKGTGAFAKSVELTRPFGQINVIEKNTTLRDYVGVLRLAYTVPDKFNVETGATTGTINLHLTAGKLPTADGDRKANMFYDFIFAPTTGQTTLGEIVLTFESNDAHVSLPDYKIPANMPVVRNKRTNISGSILKANSNDVKLTVTVSDGWTKPDEEKDIDPAPKVGDYFYQDGTWGTAYINNASNPCIGIVFEVNADGESGKIVSLDETTAAWATDGTTYATTKTNANNLADGTANMAIIKNLDDDYSDFPAFQWCANRTKGGLAWYLPAPYELQDLYAATCGLKIVDANPQDGEVERWNISSDYMKNSSNYSTQRDAFREKIIAAGGTEFCVSSYFSSCESGERYVTKAQCYGSGVCGTEIKTSFFPARAIAKFPKP